MIDIFGLNFLVESRLIKFATGVVKRKYNKGGGKHTYKEGRRLLGYKPIQASCELLVS